MAARHSDRAKSAHPRKPRRKRTPSASMPTASAAAILREVRQRLEVAQAAAAVTAAGLRSAVDCDPEAATTLQRCVCDPIAEQMNWLDWVAKHCQPLARMLVGRKSRAVQAPDK
jgi:hypothetical protein